MRNIEFQVKGSGRKGWFWFRGGRRRARKAALKGKHILMKNVNFKKREENRVPEKDVLVFVDGVRVR